MMILKIEKLAHEERGGDWHDRPLRYAVNGPGTERQLFSTQREAKQYRAIRRRAVSERAAHTTYVQAP